jgi:hypothetical protein
MFYALSIYLLDIVAAADCDYRSYSYLGLSCPFCNSAVFLHGASSRTSNGKEIPVRAYFAHAVIDRQLENPKELAKSLSCEARSHSREGLDFVDRMRSEAKGQRLSIFCDFLWEMFADSRKISKEAINQITDDFGDRWCKENTKLVRSTIKKELSGLYRLIQETTAPHQQTTAAVAFELIMDAKEAKKQAQQQAVYFAECDRIHHIQICREIVEFLGMASGNYALEKILKSTLQFIATTTKQQPAAIKKGFKPSEFASMVVAMIAGTHWIEAIARRHSLPGQSNQKPRSL